MYPEYKVIINIQGGPEKPHKVYSIRTLQPCVIVSRGFHQNVRKLINNTKTEKILTLHLNILCLVTNNQPTLKTLPATISRQTTEEIRFKQA